ncbi:hypothetical protein ElyMa_002721700 [Elysia marginata]|uniref:Uncharacterized protein n=1 Tax=Elysia marginata TaxID=1093978 RepID=A0AAV4HI37_9GAST|nr:hypothetical protein ElyMa_002721700 [Elysia marginata]
MFNGQSLPQCNYNSVTSEELGWMLRVTSCILAARTTEHQSYREETSRSREIRPDRQNNSNMQVAVLKRIRAQSGPGQPSLSPAQGSYSSRANGASGAETAKNTNINNNNNNNNNNSSNNYRNNNNNNNNNNSSNNNNRKNNINNNSSNNNNRNNNINSSSHNNNNNNNNNINNNSSNNINNNKNNSNNNNINSSRSSDRDQCCRKDSAYRRMDSAYRRMDSAYRRMDSAYHRMDSAYRTVLLRGNDRGNEVNPTQAYTSPDPCSPRLAVDAGQCVFTA